MANLLIIDDEDLTVKRLQDSIDWESIGIAKVLTSFSMSQAKRVFASERIDIMLCDIEMPAGSGLELLHWVREQDYDTISIFLTGYASFSYAKEALSLETMEYILKPVSFGEVKQAVSKAVAQLQEKRSEKEDRYLSFFRQLVQGEILPLEDSIQRIACRLHVDIAPGFSCIPVLISSKNGFQKKENNSYWDIKPAVINISVDSFPQLLCRPMLLSQKILLLFPGSASPPLELDAFLETASAALSVELLLCVGREVSLEALRPEILTLVHTEQNLVKTSGVFFFSEHKSSRNSSASGPEPDFPLWTILLEQGDSRGVTSHVRQYLESCRSLNRSDLFRFYQNYLQMLGIFLNKMQISPKKLESFFHEDAASSLPQLLKWVETVNCHVCLLLDLGDDANVVERTKAYVNNHILGEISRSQVSKSIHVSPEYLSRVFRQKTGQSLVEYITDVKMNAAREMLSHSDKPVSQIASQLGYSNFSYFSQLFRSHFSLSPSEFRRMNPPNSSD